MPKARRRATAEIPTFLVSVTPEMLKAASGWISRSRREYGITPEWQSVERWLEPFAQRISKAATSKLGAREIRLEKVGAAAFLKVFFLIEGREFLQASFHSPHAPSTFAWLLAVRLTQKRGRKRQIYPRAANPSKNVRLTGMQREYYRRHREREEREREINSQFRTLLGGAAIGDVSPWDKLRAEIAKWDDRTDAPTLAELIEGKKTP